MIYPEKIHHFFDATEGMPREQQYIQMAWSALTGFTARHQDDPEGYFFHRNYMVRYFTTRYKKLWGELNDLYQWFEVRGVRGRPVYYLTPKAEDELGGCILETLEEESHWVDLRSGTPVQKLPPSMYKTDRQDLRAVMPSVLLPKLVEINTDVLSQGQNYLELLAQGKGVQETSEGTSIVNAEVMRHLDDVEGWATKSLKQLYSLRNAATNPDWGIGKLPQSYRQARSGRWFVQGIGFSNLRRVVRKLALSHLYEYDLDNAQLHLLLQLAQGPDWPAIQRYIDLKSEIRKWAANDLDLPEDKIKEAFLILGFGGSPHGGSIREALSGKHKDFVNLDYISDIVSELSEASSHAVATAERSGNHKFVLNAMGKSIEVNALDRQIVAHLCQGAEARVLTSVLDSPWGSDVQVTVHDGWYSSGEINIKQLEEYIYQDCGFNVKIRYERTGSRAPKGLAPPKCSVMHPKTNEFNA